MDRMRLRPALALCSLVLLAGCGDDDDGGASAPETQPKAAETTAKPKPKPKRGETVKLVGSQFGRVLGDRRGQAFYLFDKEKRGKSECYGACAKAWPPVLTKGEPRAGTGARKGLLGTVERRDGKLQVTYKGRPMYYYEHDGPGRVLCHNVDEFGGLWLVVRADGAPVG